MPAKTQSPKAPKMQGQSFEAALSRLEEIVQTLESGELDLEAALAAFEEGAALSRHCAAKLKSAQQRIEILSPNEAEPNGEGEGEGEGEGGAR